MPTFWPFLRTGAPRQLSKQRPACASERNNSKARGAGGTFGQESATTLPLSQRASKTLTASKRLRDVNRGKKKVQIRPRLTEGVAHFFGHFWGLIFPWVGPTCASKPRVPFAAFRFRVFYFAIRHRHGMVSYVTPNKLSGDFLQRGTESLGRVAQIRV